MKLLAFAILCFPYSAKAQGPELERINFFPLSRHYLQMTFAHSAARIKASPSTGVSTSSEEFQQRTSLSFGRRFSPSLILGAEVDQSDDNRAFEEPGLPSLEKRSVRGIYQLEFFSILRLRPEQENQGLIDLNLSYSPKFADRGIQGQRSFHFNTRDEVVVELSHGLREGVWEFRSALGSAQTFFGVRGPGFSSSSDYWGNFGLQRRLGETWFLAGSLGLVYQSRRRFEQPLRVSQEIESGTGSLLEASLKKTLAPAHLLELTYLLHRRGYFTKSSGGNFHGSWVDQSLFVKYGVGFN